MGEVPQRRSVAYQGEEQFASDPEFAAKLALNAWLQSGDPPRCVPRPLAFFDNIVEVLWDAEVRAASDIASIEARDLNFGSATARGFFRLRVFTEMFRS